MLLAARKKMRIVAGDFDAAQLDGMLAAFFFHSQLLPKLHSHRVCMR
jgi:hypothetical protein